MKTKRYISALLTLATAALLNHSCLKVDMVDTTTKDKYYKTEQHAHNAIMGAYNTLYTFTYHKTNWPMVHAAMEDAMFVTSTGVPNSMSNNTHTANTLNATNFWGTLYTGINACNEILERVPAIVFQNENKKNRIIAEAYFLRGLLHYDLVRMYGWDGIPLRTKTTNNLTQAYEPATPTNKVYEQIIEDLEYAAGNNPDGTLRLPLYREATTEVGRATNGTARAVLAEVHLTIGHWQEAIDNADIVINSDQYKFIDNYADLWSVEKEAASYSEHIFIIPFFRDKDAQMDASLGSNVAFFYCPSGVNEDGSNFSGNPNGKGEGGYKVQKWFISYFQNDVGKLGYSDPKKSSETENLIYKDYRIETSFFRGFKSKNNNTGELSIKTAYPASGSGQDNWGYIKKYIDPKGINNRTNENDVPRLRLSDMYLIKAEALNELDNYSKACQALDVVRERARKANGIERTWPKYVGSDRADNIKRTLSKDEFRWLVFMERGLEFAGEQKRWFDMKRMKYNNMFSMYDYMMKEFLPTVANSELQSDGVLAERKKFLPKPFIEVERNPGVKQNPGF